MTKPAPLTPLSRLHIVDRHPTVENILDEVVEGLGRMPKKLAPKLFYDARGSELFEEITRLPEYYPTETEVGILAGRAEEIAAAIGPGSWLVELGSGSSRKARILLDRLRRPVTYVPVDISRQALLASASSVTDDYDDVEVIGVCTDYTSSLDLPPRPPGRRVVVFFPGSTIGNLDPLEAQLFLRRIAATLQRGDAMLIGVDLEKDEGILHAAYNDARGVTASFNLNLLVRLNRDLGADFDLAGFEHQAFYDPLLRRIEMHLRSLRRQQVRIAGRTFRFEAGETIHTENSWKYSLARFRDLIEPSGFTPAAAWMDEAELFSVHYLLRR